MGLAEVKDGIDAALANVVGLKGRIYDGWPENGIHEVAAIVLPKSQSDSTFSGRGNVLVDIDVVVKTTSVRAAQNALDDLLKPTGTSSIKTALEAAPTLPVSGTPSAEGLMFLDPWFDDYGSFQIDGINYLGATLHLEVWVTF